MLYWDELYAVLPPDHPLAGQEQVSLRQLAGEPFILLDEGDYSVAMHAFMDQGLSPNTEYLVYDDYTILAMVRRGLGVSAMYRLVLSGFEEGLDIRPIREKPERPIALAWNNWETMSFASRKFAEFVFSRADEMRNKLL